MWSANPATSNGKYLPCMAWKTFHACTHTKLFCIPAFLNFRHNLPKELDNHTSLAKQTTLTSLEKNRHLLH
jgi:hypothetical protein